MPSIKAQGGFAMLFAMMLAMTVSAAPARAELTDEQLYKAAGAKAPKPAATVAYGTAKEQYGDLRLPKGKGPHPVAVIIHGGCWTNGYDTPGSTGALAQALTDRGIATWAIEYREGGDTGGGWPGTFEDVAAGVDKVADIATKYRLDLSRVTIIGHSAGAHLALWAASRSKLPAPWTAKALKPISVVAIDGPALLAPFIGPDRMVCGKPVIVPFMGGTPAEKPEAYALAQPATKLPFGVRQLLVTGTLGMAIQPYAQAVRRSGDQVEVLTPPKANHFDIVTPGTPNGDAVVEWIAANALKPSTPPPTP